MTTAWYERFIDGGYIPDFLLREGCRYLMSLRASQIQAEGTVEIQERKMGFVEALKKEKIAIHTQAANEQHYEVPTEFIRMCLGPRMKYSCCFFPQGNETLQEAELYMLESYVQKAQIQDGMRLFDLGCGWGSLCLYLCEHFPNSPITALSNSKTQKTYIDAEAKRRGFDNLTVITKDVVDFDTADSQFDRILSIEMLEHMKNYGELFKNIARWLKPDGLFFCHVFSHKLAPYHFETDEDHSWMARYFFTAMCGLGGTMPSNDLFLYFQDHLSVENHWFINGAHYGQTSELWLRNMDEHKDEALKSLIETYGDSEGRAWFHRWRLFYITVAEFFKFNSGNEWGVTHYLFRKK